MKKRIKLLAGAAALLLLTGCGGRGEADQAQATEATYRQISQEEAAEIMNTQGDFLLLDVRTQAEFDRGHIPGAVCLPADMIAADMPFPFGKDAEILVYCQSGHRSADAASKLRTLGFTDVSDIGGIADWPYETTTD